MVFIEQHASTLDRLNALTRAHNAGNPFLLKATLSNQTQTSFKQKMSYLYSAFRFLVIYKEQKIYSVFSVNLDIGPHTVSVTSKITENSLVTDICHQRIFGIFAGDRHLSAANLPTFCY